MNEKREMYNEKLIEGFADDKNGGGDQVLWLFSQESVLRCNIETFYTLKSSTWIAEVIIKISLIP